MGERSLEDNLQTLAELREQDKDAAVRKAVAGARDLPEPNATHWRASIGVWLGVVSTSVGLAMEAPEALVVWGLIVVLGSFQFFPTKPTRR